MNERLMLLSVIATISLALSPTNAAEADWRFQASTDRMSDQDRSYITTRSKNQLRGLLGAQTIDLLVFCSGYIQVNSQALGFKQDYMDCDEYTCDDLQFVRTKIDNGKSVTYNFDVFDIHSVGFRYYQQTEKQAKFTKQMQKGNELLLELGVIDYGEQIAEFSLRGFTAAASRCPQQSSLHKLITERDQNTNTGQLQPQDSHPATTDPKREVVNEDVPPASTPSLIGDWYSDFPDYGSGRGMEIYRVITYGDGFEAHRISAPYVLGSTFGEMNIRYQISKLQDSNYLFTATTTWDCSYPGFMKMNRNSCPIDLEVELTSVGSDRISGRVFGPDFGLISNQFKSGSVTSAYKKACKNCASKLPMIWNNFTWERKE